MNQSPQDNGALQPLDDIKLYSLSMNVHILLLLLVRMGGGQMAQNWT